MKQITHCANCGGELDTTKRAFVYSPKSQEYIHLRCFVSELTQDISYGLRKIIHDEADHEKVIAKKPKEPSFH